MKMKKINWLTTLLLAVMVSLAACTGGAGETEEAEEGATPQEVVETTEAETDTAVMEYDSSAIETDSLYEEEQEASNDDAN